VQKAVSNMKIRTQPTNAPLGESKSPQFHVLFVVFLREEKLSAYC